MMEATTEIDAQRAGSSARGLNVLKFSCQFPTLFTKWYVASKVTSDPAYNAVFSELIDTELPLLDIGCGMGVLAFYLSSRGFDRRVVGFDYDETKITDANAVREKFYPDAPMHFSAGDARVTLPEHLGSVTILDILQYFSAEEMEKLLRQAARCVAPGGKIVIRSGLVDDGWRFRVTTAVDKFARRVGWMQGSPVQYPTAAQFRSVLVEEGLVGTIKPLWGKTPFNNYLISFSRPR